jgi:hypothetical protein
MPKRMTMVQEPAPAPAEPAPVEAVLPPEPLEQRVRRLEDAVAALQDTHLIEERVVERVQARLQGKPEPPPAAVPARQAASEQMYDAARYTPPPPAEPVNPLPYVAAAARLLPGNWLVVDLYTELRAMIRMFFDIHYHVAWTTRLTVLVLVPVILLSHWWFPFAWVPLFGAVVDKIVDLVLAFFVYKALSREAQRYLAVRPGGVR